jgi:hypothetical protein
LGVETLLSALDVTEGNGNLYLTNVAVMGRSCDKGAGGVGAGAGAGAGGVGAGAGAGAGGVGAGAGAGAAASVTFLKISRLFKILTNPRSNVINPFNISLVDEI